MPTFDTIKRLFLLASLLCCMTSVAAAQTSTITYQGRLTDGGTPPNGLYDFQFKLYDALTGGSLQGSPNTVTKTGVNVATGVFTVQLDFGAGAFPGADRFLEINVKHPADTSYATLLPRVQLTSSPYAIRSGTAASADTAMNATQLGGTAAGQYVLTNDSRLNDARSPTSGSSNYIQNNPVTQQSASFNISGNGTLGGTLTARNLVGNGTGITNIAGTFLWHEVTGTSQQAQPNNGYVANNVSEVTITLPTSANVGDTIRVSAGGAAGWRIAPNSGQQILATFQPSNWTGSKSWTSVTSSADGSKLVAVAQSDQIYTSTDSGVTWTQRENGRQWQSVASSADGSKLVAGARFGQIYTSTDSGATWTPRESNRQWSSVASSADGSKLVTVAQGDQIYTSTDSGATWTPREGNRSWSSVASSADGSKLVAVTSGGLGGQIYTSTDSGATWTPRESNRSWLSVASSADGSKLVAVVQGGQIYTSIDSGVTWTPRESNRLWVSVASSADGSKLVAVVVNGQIYTSTDSGATWTPRESSRNWRSVASSADGSKLVAVEFQIYSSTNSGVTWSTSTPTIFYLTGDRLSAIELQYLGGGLFFPLSREGSIIAH
jgi:photosystem II stability/assembly factor-like uncharacterized protein